MAQLAIPVRQRRVRAERGTAVQAAVSSIPEALTGHFSRQLMAKKPEDRLGCTGGGWKEVREHPFFASVDWSKLLAKKVKPPIRPLIKVW